MAFIEANKENFDNAIKDGFVFLYFYGDHCGPCKAFVPTLIDLDFEFPFINIVKVNTDHQIELAKRYGVRGVPSLVFLKDGQEVQRKTGGMESQELKSLISELLYE